MSPDTIYGIACLAQHVGGVHSMYRIKGRDEGKPLAICVGDVDQIQRFDSLLSFIRIIPDLLYYIIYRFWFLILQNSIIILDFHPKLLNILCLWPLESLHNLTILPLIDIPSKHPITCFIRILSCQFQTSPNRHDCLSHFKIL